MIFALSRLCLHFFLAFMSYFSLSFAHSNKLEKVAKKNVWIFFRMDVSNEENVTGMDFIANMIDLLEKDAIDELRETIINTDHRTLNIAFLELFSALMNKYDDLTSEDRNRQSLLTVVIHLTKNSHMKPKEMYVFHFFSFQVYLKKKKFRLI